MANSLVDPGIQIPLQNEKTVHVFREDMEQNVDGVLQLLKVEVPALSVWANFATQYFQLGNDEAALNVLSEADKVAVDRSSDSKGKALLLIARGSYHTEQYRKSKEESKSAEIVDDHFNKANDCFRQATTLMQDEIQSLEEDSEMIWVAKGYLALFSSKNNNRTAREAFNAAMDVTQNKSYAANLGLGNIHFLQGDFKAAARSYAKVLKLYPQCSPDVRVCLGHSYLKMKNLELAQKCYERALELDPTNSEALTSLAMMKMSNEKDGRDPNVVKSNVTALFNAHCHNPNSAVTLNGLAFHFFNKMRYNKVIELCSRSVERTSSDSIKGRAYLLMARTYHKEQNFEQATKFYKLARNCFKGNDELLFDPALFMGLGQMALHNNDLKTALNYFEKGLAKNPNCKELLLVLGTLYAKNPKLKKTQAAIKYLQKVIELDNVDYEARLELGNLYRSMSTDSTKKEALKLYKRSIKAMTEVHGKHPKPGLINNIAILYQKLGDMENAKKEFIKALKLSKEAHNNNGGVSNGKDNTTSNGDTSDDQAADDATLNKYLQGDYLYEKNNITITFNVALYLTASGDRDTAERLHLGIVEKFPGYGESYICLGQMYRERDMNDKAIGYFTKAMNSYEEATANKAVNILANIRLEAGDVDGAKKLFSSLQQKSGKRDIYAQLSLANIEFQAAMENEGRKRQDHLNFALKIYKRILQKDDSNIYAANGIGMVLAERGHLTFARDIFTKVRDAAFDVPDPTINLAKVQIQLKKIPAAIQLFQTCIQSFGPGDGGLHFSYLAAAYRAAGKHEDCLKVLQRAVRSFPEIADHWYELSSTMCTVATELYGKFSQVTSLNDKITKLKRMRCYFTAAAKYRKWYLNVCAGEIDEQEKQDATAFVQKCAEYLKGVESGLRTANESKAVRDQQFQKMREEQLERERQEAEAKRLKDLEEAKKREDMEKEWATGQQEFTEKANIFREQNKKRKKTPGKKREKKAQKKAKTNGDGDSSSSSSDSDSSDSDSDSDNAAAGKAALFGSDSEDDDDDKDAGAVNSSANTAAKKMVVEEDDDDDDDDDENDKTEGPSKVVENKEVSDEKIGKLFDDDDDDEDSD